MAAAVAQCRRGYDPDAGRIPKSQLYKEEIEPNIQQGATLAFAHGFAIHYNQVVPRADLDVIMIAPKAPGHTVRSTNLLTVAVSPI